MKKGIVYTLVSALLYGFTPILGYVTYSLGNDPITLTFFRNILTIPVLLFIIFKNKISEFTPFQRTITINKFIPEN